jgi:GINS complex subunit 4
MSLPHNNTNNNNPSNTNNNSNNSLNAPNNVDNATVAVNSAEQQPSMADFDELAILPNNNANNNNKNDGDEKNPSNNNSNARDLLDSSNITSSADLSFRDFQTQGNNNYSRNNSNNRETQEERDNRKALHLLKECWLNEQFSPELRFYEDSIVLSAKELIARQQARINKWKKAAKKANSNVDTVEPFIIELYELEVDRILYMLYSYHRIRLYKIEKYCLFYLKYADEQQSDQRLNEHELSYMKKYCDLFGNHMHSSFLVNLPPAFQTLDELNMIPQPNLNNNVWARVVNDENSNLNNVWETRLLGDGNISIELQPGAIYAGQYSLFQQLLLEGKLELI